ncbi:hypothetical protein Hneap_0940 [Halothiobacillus neapolitanus c2]|uniref:Uncharacterized protein n=1 Tax=Halothiobacillus neapolitanus (strain ATCC 23641 / DSM 15147 / CIP 104769 / NCIMB 8539 / c2) TaxID=555778 RepID=D0KZA9_HALNC|nr:hypothetical protein Hneap_0940 [Halothiobacillus neapolitanus c2]TDN66089.1 hypothetical protein C8D83_101410 [Halothiobacillus neapolitanus]
MIASTSFFPVAILMLLIGLLRKLIKPDFILLSLLQMKMILVEHYLTHSKASNLSFQ